MMTFVPVWTPLQSLAASDPRIKLGDWMFMGTVVGTNPIHLYKHCDTRRYLNIDDAGDFHEYLGITDTYTRIPNLPTRREHAIRWVLSLDVFHVVPTREELREECLGGAFDGHTVASDADSGL